MLLKRKSRSSLLSRKPPIPCPGELHVLRGIFLPFRRRITTNRKVWTLVVAIITFLLALGLTLYPIISSRYNTQHQSKICADYQAQVGQADTAAIDQARELAKQYNIALQPGVQGVTAFSHEAMELASQDYADLLNITGSGIMGYVEIPAIAVTLPIYHGTADATLEKGVGHLLGTSLPVGGAGTHTVLTGHSGMASQKMFTDLNQLAVGDVFFLDVLGGTVGLSSGSDQDGSAP